MIITDIVIRKRNKHNTMQINTEPYLNECLDVLNFKMASHCFFKEKAMLPRSKNN